MNGFLGAEIGMLAGACGLLLVSYWDDISSAFGPSDGAAEPDDDDLEENAATEEMGEGTPGTLGAAEDPGDLSFSNRLAEALGRGEVMLGDGSQAREGEEDEERAGEESPADAADTDAEAQPGFLLPESLDLPDNLDADSIALITDFNPETDVITLQYDGTGSEEEPEITVSPSEDGASSEIRVNGKTYGLVEGVRDLDASQVALVDIGEDTGEDTGETTGGAGGETASDAGEAA